MHQKPVLNDPSDPLISVQIYNYDGQHLKACLESVFKQDILKNIEVIYVDDATNDGSWEVALSYVERYGSLMTISRNRRVLGPRRNAFVCRRMSKGRYTTSLTGDALFRPKYVRSCIRSMQEDPHVFFPMVKRMVEVSPPAPSVIKGPLVSILCYNYNYGPFLRQSLESALTQTYKNIEVCFSDNASTDESWKIALEFNRRFPGKMNLVRNRQNYGSDANFENCFRVMRGKYFVNFCSDDVMRPEYVERCVEALESRPNTGLAVVNRSILDADNCLIEEPPFYNRSCIIPGEEQAAVYMMAGVNPSVSQIMYRRDLAENRAATGALTSRYYGTRIFDFNVSLEFDVAFIKDSLLLHRMHGGSDTSQADRSLLPVVGIYVLNHQLADLAAVRGVEKVAKRLPRSLEKLARLAIRYSVRLLQADNEEVALKYFYLAMAIDPRVLKDEVGGELQTYWTSDSETKREIVQRLGSHSNLAARSVSYDPPPGSIPIWDGRR